MENVATTSSLKKTKQKKNIAYFSISLVGGS